MKVRSGPINIELVRTDAVPYLRDGTHSGVQITIGRGYLIVPEASVIDLANALVDYMEADY